MFEVSSSGYYAYLKHLPSQRALFKRQLDERIKTLFEQQTEWIYQKLENIAQAKSMILWYIEAYYNRVRKHSHLNYLSPVQFEEKMI